MVIVPLITPYYLSEIYPLIDHILRGGVTSLFLLGTTGEFQKLNVQRKREIIHRVASYVGQRAKLFVGITGATVKESLSLLKIAEEVHAFASVIAPAVLGDCTEVLEKIVLASIGKILLYNNPLISRGESIPLECVAEFAREKRVVGIKDSSRDASYFHTLMSYKHSGFSVYYGAETGLKEALQKGIDGFVPSTANYAPHLACQLWQDLDSAPWEAWNAIKGEIRAKNTDNYIAALKLFLKERGLINCELTL